MLKISCIKTEEFLPFLVLDGELFRREHINEKVDIWFSQLNFIFVQRVQDMICFSLFPEVSCAFQYIFLYPFTSLIGFLLITA